MISSFPNTPIMDLMTMQQKHLRAALSTCVDNPGKYMEELLSWAPREGGKDFDTKATQKGQSDGVL